MWVPHSQGASSLAAASFFLPEMAAALPSACPGDSELKLSPGSCCSTLSAIFSRPGKVASTPCFYERPYSDVSLLRRTSRRKSNRQPGTTRPSRPTRSRRSHRTSGLAGCFWPAGVLRSLLLRWLRHGRWVARSRGGCRSRRRGWHFRTAEVRWRLLLNLALEAWWLPKHVCVQCCCM